MGLPLRVVRTSRGDLAGTTASLGYDIGGNRVTPTVNGETYANGHLQSISNSIGTSEGYEFGYTGEQGLVSPFDGTGFGTAARLSEVRVAGMTLKHQMEADGAGQLRKVVFPYGGYLKWEYGAWNYAGRRRQMEVVSRWTSKDGLAGTEKRYDFAHDDPNDGTRAAHSSTKLDDPGLIGGRT